MCKFFKVFSLKPEDVACKDVGVIVHYEISDIEISEVIKRDFNVEDDVRAAKAANTLKLTSLFKYLTKNNFKLHYLHIIPRPISSQFSSHSSQLSTHFPK